MNPKVARPHKVILSFVVVVLLCACDPAAGQPIAAIIEANVPTPTPQPSPTFAPTPDISTVPVEEVVQMYIEGVIDYPAEWPDEKKAQFSIALVDYINSNNSPEVFAVIHLNGVDEIVGWNPSTRKWEYESSGASIDKTGDSFAELAVAGYIDANGQEVIIDAETGALRTLERVNWPRLGERSLTELYAMGQEALRGYLMDVMSAQFPNIPEGISYRIEVGRDDHFPLPVVIDVPATRSEKIYAKVVISDMLLGFSTNEVLFPVFDNESHELILWLRVYQGATMFTNSFAFSSGNEPTWAYTSEAGRFFGSSSDDSFAILFPGNTTQIAYESHGGAPFLETTSTGIGDGADIKQILEAGDTGELIALILRFRMLVLFPDQILFEQ